MATSFFYIYIDICIDINHYQEVRIPVAAGRRGNTSNPCPYKAILPNMERRCLGRAAGSYQERSCRRPY